MNVYYERLTELGEKMLKTKKDYDILNFRLYYIKCIIGKFGNVPMIQAYLYMEQLIIRIKQTQDKAFLRAVCKLF